MMVMHVSDLHVGAKPYGVPRLKEHVLEAFDRVVEVAVRERPDMILIGGDLFDEARPEHETLIHVIDQLKRVSERGIRVVAAHGEHDYPGRRDSTVLEVVAEAVDGFYAPRPRSLDSVVEDTIVRFDGVTIAVYPFVRAITEKNRRLAKEIILPAYRRALERVPGRRILLAHFSLEEVFPLDAIASISELPPVDYAAMGHVHQRHIVEGQGPVKALAYPGSLYPLRMEEAAKKHVRGPLLVDLSGDEPQVSEVEVEVARHVVLEPVDLAGARSRGARPEDVLRRRLLSAVKENQAPGMDLVVHLRVVLGPTDSPGALDAYLRRIPLPRNVVVLRHVKWRGAEARKATEVAETVDHAEIIMEEFGLSRQAAMEILELKDALAADEVDEQYVLELLENLSKRGIDRVLDKLLR